MLISLFFSVSIYAQHIGIKHNLAYDVTLTPNLGVEVAFSKKITFEVSAGYNPFEFDDTYLKHFFIQPELKYWFCEKFNGFYVGLHGHYGDFDVCNIKLPFDLYQQLNGRRYDVSLYGAGLSLGYGWPLSKRWNLETAVGAGYARVKYARHHSMASEETYEPGYKNYFGPTSASISFIYFIR